MNAPVMVELEGETDPLEVRSLWNLVALLKLPRNAQYIVSDTYGADIDTGILGGYF